MKIAKSGCTGNNLRSRGLASRQLPPFRKGELWGAKAVIVFAMANGKILIGTSGFSYKDWLGNFYPTFCSTQDFLKFYCSRFKTVEIDSTFYRIPTVETVARWYRNSSRDFIFTAKFPRAVTHEGNISERISAARAFLSVMDNLKEKRGPLLMQFPYSFKPDCRMILYELLEAMPASQQMAVELRHKGWLDDDGLMERLRKKNFALCLIDHPWMPRLNLRTADFLYLRFLGDRKKIESDFSYVRNDRRQEMDWWKKVITSHAEAGHRVYAYFNNHYSGHAPTTAMRMSSLVSENETKEQPQ